MLQEWRAVLPFLPHEPHESGVAYYITT